jgi:hypothetical protein
VGVRTKNWAWEPEARSNPDKIWRVGQIFFWTPSQHLQKALKSFEIIMINAKYAEFGSLAAHQPILFFLGRFGAEKAKVHSGQESTKSVRTENLEI